MKICYTCKKEKNILDFSKNKAKKDGYSHNCRNCESAIKKDRYNKSEKKSTYKRNELTLIKKKEYYLNNKEKILENRKEYYNENKEKIKECHANFYREHKDTIIEDQKEYYNKNRGKIIKKVVDYEMNRRKNDEYYRMFKNIKCRFRNALKAYTIKGKVKSCAEYGIDFKKIYEHLGDAPGKNYHIDHIIPLSMFDLTIPEHVSLAYSTHNLRWLEGKENISKNDKLIDVVFIDENLKNILDIITHNKE